MKIYYSVYNPGEIEVKTFDIIQKNIGSYIIKQLDFECEEKLSFDDIGIILKHGFDIFGIWSVGANSLKSVNNTLRLYAIENHARNIKRLEKELLKEEDFLEWLTLPIK